MRRDVGYDCGGIYSISIFQDDKDSDSSKEPLDDLFPNDDDDQGPGSKCVNDSYFFLQQMQQFAILLLC